MRSTGDRRVLRCGPSAWLVECGSAEEVAAVYRALLGAADVVEVVPAATTVLVEMRGGARPRLGGVGTSVASELVGAGTGAGAGEGTEGGAGGGTDEGAGRPTVELATSYDGPDLAEVAELTGLTPAAVVERHLAAEYTVAFCGFAPGFGYLTGGDPALAVPRRVAPRPAVAPGSVGLAGPYTGVYPRRSPGGWQLIGTTDAPLWDLARAEPALLVPGRRVRFVPVEGR